MRKNIYQTSAILLAAATFTSCNVDEETNQIENQSMRFTASIGETATQQTRATGTSWDTGDAIGIFMLENGTTTIAEEAENREYTTANSTDGTFSPTTPANAIYYPMDGSAVSFTAYYPYKAGATLTTPLDIEIATDQTVADIQPTFDLLYANALNNDNGYTKTSGTTVVLPFYHKLSKLVMNCTAEANVGITNFNNVTVTIKGMHTQNTFDLSNGMLGTATTIADIIPRKLAGTPTSKGTSYDAIIMPGSYDENVVTVEFNVDGDIFTWKVNPIYPAITVNFEGGNEYTYTVNLTRTGVEAIGTISPWTGIDRGNVTAD